jgi:hypothetical protein
MQNLSDGDIHILVDLLRRLKPSDLSVLEAALVTPDSQIATVRNSANDVFWSRLVEAGLGVEMTLDIEIPPQLSRFQPKSFALTEQGRIVVPQLLRLAMEDRANGCN